MPDAVTREAYSHEVSSAGFWPGNDQHPHATFFSYAYPTQSAAIATGCERSAGNSNGLISNRGQFPMSLDTLRDLAELAHADAVGPGRAIA